MSSAPSIVVCLKSLRNSDAGVTLQKRGRVWLDKVPKLMVEEEKQEGGARMQLLREHSTLGVGEEPWKTHEKRPCRPGRGRRTLRNNRKNRWGCYLHAPWCCQHSKNTDPVFPAHGSFPAHWFRKQLMSIFSFECVLSQQEPKMQYLDAISKTTEWSLFISKINHSISW